MNEPKPEDVMRALECCNRNGNCSECPYDRARFEHEPDCASEMTADALALLREKDKEIERLREKSKEWRDCADKLFEEVETARAEAITEFVERVKKAHDVLDVNGYLMIGVDIVELIAEEMKG